jgi:hypothetical protein
MNQPTMCGRSRPDGFISSLTFGGSSHTVDAPEVFCFNPGWLDALQASCLRGTSHHMQRLAIAPFALLKFHPASGPPGPALAATTAV